MNDVRRIKLAAAAAERLALLSTALGTTTAGTTVIGRMRDQQVGVRAKSYEGAAPGAMRHDATFAALGRSDDALADERDLDAAIVAIVRALNAAWRIVGKYPPPARPDVVNRIGLGLVGLTDAACQNCARIPGEAGGPRFSPVRSDLVGATTVGGRLEVAQRLCAWCYGCVRDWGRVPTTDELERHHQGKRVGWPDDVERPA